jgi:hypothetical protein
MNTRLNQFVSVAKQSDKMIRLICVNGADPLLQLNGQNLNQLQTYLIRTKTVKVSPLTILHCVMFDLEHKLFTNVNRNLMIFWRF